MPGELCPGFCPWAILAPPRLIALLLQSPNALGSFHPQTITVTLVYKQTEYNHPPDYGRSLL